MKSILITCLLGAIIAKIDARRFRCDYKYFKEANGYIKYQEMPATWEEAKQRCEMEGTILASPLTPGIRNAMHETLNGNCDKGVWTGFRSVFVKGDFSSIEGVPLAETPHTWANCEPDNKLNNEQCIAQHTDGKLADANCNLTLSFFCYQKTYPGMIMNACGSMDNEYVMEKRNGKCYKFHKSSKVWDKALMTCQAEGGHLAIINSDLEAQVIKDVIGRTEYKGYVSLLGFRKTEKGEWKTIHGQTLEQAGYNKWAPNEPSSPKEQFCGGAYSSGLLDDVWCDRPAIFICEKDPESLMCGHEKK